MALPKAQFFAHARDGELRPTNPAAFLEHLKSYGPEDRLVVTVAKQTKPRSDEQRGYYFGVVLKVIAHETGHSVEEVHEVMKRKYLPRRIVPFNGKEYPLPGSTTDLSKMEFSEYMTKCIAEAGELGIVIPAPEPMR